MEVLEDRKASNEMAKRRRKLAKEAAARIGSGYHQDQSSDRNEPTQPNTSQVSHSKPSPQATSTMSAPLTSSRPHSRTISRTSVRRWAQSLAGSIPLLVGLSLMALLAQRVHSAQPEESNLKFDGQTGAYQGLTFTFDPRLNHQVEQRLHFEHWLSIMQQSSSLLHKSLNGRAHLAEIKVLIPFKWRQLSAELRPVLYKPGAPVITNRRLRFTDSDVIVGFEDPVYKETPYSLQHDECGRPGLNIRMPISFLDQRQPSAKSSGGHLSLDSRLKARQFVRELASHRFGIFKESGFRSDYMYPPFSSVAGYSSPADGQQQQQPTNHHWHRWAQLANGSQTAQDQPHFEQQLAMGPSTNGGMNRTADYQQQQEESSGENTLAGFDEHFRPCKFETSPASGLPANAQAANCLPYLVTADKSLGSFSLMSADPFSYATGGEQPSTPERQSGTGAASSNLLPVQWDKLADQTKWHFCGENFASANYAPPSPMEQQTGAAAAVPAANNNKLVHYEHNQRATNKQNKMCQERSALEVIRLSEDFRNHQQFSPPLFNRLPEPSFRFLQEMPPRLILCIEYTSHLFQSRRLDHAILQSAINKFLALDLIADSELVTVVFGQHQSRLLDSASFQRLDSSLNSRFTLFNPAIDPFDEQAQYFSQEELEKLEVQSDKGATATNQQQQQQPVKILKGSCSFAKLMAEVNVLLEKSSAQYDDIGADLLVLTSGLFVEDEPKIEEILRNSNFKLENNRLNMILYPSTMLFDTKSHEGLIVLDSIESEQIIRSRVNKLLLIQRLTGAKLHLIREQLDSSGDVKMSTLVQFYQVFDQLAKGHSWDQTNSTVMLQSQQVDSRQQQPSGNSLTGQQQQQQPQHKLTFQFNLDESIQNELIVGFIDPKVPHQANLLDRHYSQHFAGGAGKRFSLKDLQLRSPGGQFVFSETGTTWTRPFMTTGLGQYNQSGQDGTELVSFNNNSLETQAPAFFPFRTQLSLAGFHVKPNHLAKLAAVKRLAGTWTLSAVSDEPIQTSGVAMARVNSQGDTLTGNCWIQTYSQESVFDPASDEQLKMVKVFMQTSGQRQEVEARMEVQDEMGNIIQNVQMLDDGLGAPDMTQNDGILTQYVQRATRPGFYKVSVELITGPSNNRLASNNMVPTLTGQSGQDNVCCGSFMPNPTSEPQATSGPRVRSSRQLYCGTFFLDSKNKLARQRPPRVNNLTVVNVDQENRHVTLRWFEPQLDISSSLRPTLTGPSVGHTQQHQRTDQLVAILSDTDLLGEEDQSRQHPQAQPLQRGSRSTRLTPVGGNGGGNPIRRQVQDQDDSDSNYDDQHSHQGSLTTLLGSNVLMASHQQQTRQAAAVPLANQIDRSPAPQSHYEIKVFYDRDILKHTFDAKREVGHTFDDWSVEGQFPNASRFGGMKEVTLRVPFAREGFYFIAMKVVNDAGTASQVSNIVQFYLRNNMTNEEVQSIFNQPGMTVDAEGNVYDKNGHLVRAASDNSLASNSLIRGTSALDGLSVMILISVLVFMMVILCITLVACLASSARHSLKTNAANKTGRHHNDDGNSKKTIGSIVGLAGGGGGGPISAGSGSSMVSSSGGCESSEVGACSGSSSLAGSCTGANLHQNQNHDHQHQLAQGGGNGSSGGNLFFDELQQSQLTSYNKLQQQHRNQQQQAQMIHQQLISNKNTLNSQQQQQQDFYSQPQQQQQYYAGPNHTIVNGYTYATVMQAATQPQDQYQQQQYASGDLNQNGLVQQTNDNSDGIPTSSAVINPVQSWPADILLSHYDKVKQARERNEAPPVMRIETLEHNDGLQYSDGLPTLFVGQQQQQAELQQTKTLQYGTLREQQHQAANFYNQQLHQQLSSVLKSKRQNALDYDPEEFQATSPALDGVTGELLNTTGDNDHQTSNMPPPPHYMYCQAPADENGLGGPLTDPSIYSQTTNLQQVATSPAAVQDQLAGYYANQQQAWATNAPMAGQYGSGQQSGSLVSSGIYSTSNVDQQHSSDAAISEV